MKPDGMHSLRTLSLVRTVAWKIASFREAGTYPLTGWSSSRLLPTILHWEEPVVLDARLNSNDSSSNLYLTAARLIQSTWIPANGRRSSALETPHSLQFSSLCFANWAVDLILCYILAVVACWELPLADICLAAPALFPWPVLLYSIFSQSLASWLHLLQVKPLPDKMKESSVCHFLQIMLFLEVIAMKVGGSPDPIFDLPVLIVPYSSLNFRSEDQVIWAIDGFLLVAVCRCMILRWLDIIFSNWYRQLCRISARTRIWFTITIYSTNSLNQLLFWQPTCLVAAKETLLSLVHQVQSRRMFRPLKRLMSA